eukprot:TRINITY_DN872_c0_g1_i1.p1 TRINITY_DN872_c0_g1~~TRINITY_DN872_c0_g1_i1.p1  ORF type:complete len:1283 (+),score=264.43 TRINITY_DN872_c0_g1_i1:138-3986(+)
MEPVNVIQVGPLLMRCMEDQYKMTFFDVENIVEQLGHQWSSLQQILKVNGQIRYSISVDGKQWVSSPDIFSLLWSPTFSGTMIDRVREEMKFMNPFGVTKPIITDLKNQSLSSPLIVKSDNLLEPLVKSRKNIFNSNSKRMPAFKYTTSLRTMELKNTSSPIPKAVLLKRSNSDPWLHSYDIPQFIETAVLNIKEDLSARRVENEEQTTSFTLPKKVILNSAMALTTDQLIVRRPDPKLLGLNLLQVHSSPDEQKPPPINREMEARKHGIKPLTLDTTEVEREKFIKSVANQTYREVQEMYGQIQGKGVSFNINGTDTKGRTALHLACLRGQKNIVKFLLKNNASLELKDDQLWSPLHFASSSSEADIISLLLSKGLDPNIKTQEKLTPLHILMKQKESDKSLKAIECLLSSGADIESKNQFNETPLFIAVSKGNVETVRLLLKKGASVTAKNKSGIDVLEYAVAQGQIEIVAILHSFTKQETEESTPDILFISILEEGNLPKIIEHIKSDSSLACTPLGNHQRTPLHIAASYGNKQLVKYLVDLNVPLNPTDIQNSTPLHYAASSNQVEIMSFLLKKGADPNCQNNDKDTCCHILLRGNLPFDKLHKVLEILVKTGLNLEACNKVNDMPMHVAISTGKIEVVEFLQKKLNEALPIYRGKAKKGSLGHSSIRSYRPSPFGLVRSPSEKNVSEQSNVSFVPSLAPVVKEQSSRRRSSSTTGTLSKRLSKKSISSKKHDGNKSPQPKSRPSSPLTTSISEASVAVLEVQDLPEPPSVLSYKPVLKNIEPKHLSYLQNTLQFLQTDSARPRSDIKNELKETKSESRIDKSKIDRESKLLKSETFRSDKPKPDMSKLPSKIDVIESKPDPKADSKAEHPIPAIPVDLILPMVLSEIDNENLVTMFFITHFNFISSLDLLAKIVQLYQEALLLDAAEKQTTQLRIFDLIIKWFTINTTDFFKEDLVEKLNSFLRYLSDSGDPLAQQWSETISSVLNVCVLRWKAAKKQFFKGAPHSILTDKTRDLQARLDVLQKRDFQNCSSLEFSAVEIARQLCIMDQQFLQDIPIEEFWLKNFEKPAKSPKLAVLQKHNNAITLWVSTEIASTPNLKNRIRTLAHHIAITEALMTLNNWNGFMNFVVALVSYPISRLKLTWKGLPHDMQEKWQKLEELASPLANFGLLRDACARSLPPALPPLSLLMKDLTFIEDGNETWFDKELHLLNFGKIELLARVGGILRRAIEERFQFSVVPVIQEYLKNLFYVEDTKMLDDFSKTSEPVSKVMPGEDRF